MSDPTVERKPPMEPLQDCTVIGARPDPVYPEIALEIRLDDLEPWARTALERGLKAWQEDVL